jgi:predicted PurR-regulated permease PerM
VIAAFGALIPSVGTTIVFIPAVVFLLFNGAYVQAIGLLVWGVLAVGLIDNLLGPYLMSRGNKLHPFIILLAVLGGLSVFGPIGFVVGPVLVSLFIVLLELYSVHISDHKKKSKD